MVPVIEEVDPAMAAAFARLAGAIVVEGTQYQIEMRGYVDHAELSADWQTLVELPEDTAP